MNDDGHCSFFLVLLTTKPFQLSQKMAFLQRFQDMLSWYCELGFDSSSSCVQRTVIDGLNILFLFLFFLVLLVGTLAKRSVNENRHRDRFFEIVSVICVVTSVTYLGFGLLVFLERNDGIEHWDWVVYLVRGSVWMGLAISLNLLKIKSVMVLSLVWWVSFSFMISVLNVKILVQNQTLRILEIVSWIVNFFLLLCSFKLLRALFSQRTENRSLSQPLLIRNCEKVVTNISFFSKLTFSWINPLLRLGYSKPLVLEDVPALEPKDDALSAHRAFNLAWEIQRKENPCSKNMVLRVLVKCYLKEMILIGFGAFLRSVAVVASPLFLYGFVEFSGRKEQNLQKGFLLVVGLVLIKIVESLSQRHWFFDSRRTGMRMRSALMAAIFQKQLKLSSLGRRKHSTGEIVNYVAVDAYRFGQFPWWFHTTWSFALQLFFAICILFGIVGWGALPGLVPIFICVLLNVPFAKNLKNYQSKFMAAQDERVRATSEFLNNMKIIKLQSWEEHFKNLIDGLRAVEFKWLASTQIQKSYGSVLYWMSPIFVSAVVFAGCAVLRSAPLIPSTVFTVLTTLRIMGEPMKILPEALSVLIQVKVSLDRIDSFLLDDELKEEDVKRILVQVSDYSVRVDGGVFSWDRDGAFPTLNNIDVEIKRGEKIAVCGSVGAGKSSLLYAILGEIPKFSGLVEVSGSIAYVAQTAWIQSGTIRDNILYGKPMIEAHYKKAIKSCALDEDLENLDHGDLTEIGQRGLNLSGGQKQRIQLARAVYNDADIYLLDDPFSAVDANTASILFNHCLMEALGKKTIVLVTHQVDFIAGFDKILVMDGGQITQLGSYEELLKAGTAFEHLVNAHQDAATSLDSLDKGLPSKDRRAVQDPSKPTESKSYPEVSIKEVSSTQLTEDEEKEIGDFGWTPFIDYIRVSKGHFLLLGVVISQSAFVILQAASTYWLAIGVQIPQISEGILVGAYTGISIFAVVFAFLRARITAVLGLKASMAFFSGFMNSVFKAPMLFFDSTPVGRILIRASSDMSVLDFDVPYSISFSLTAAIEVISILIVISVVTWQVLTVAIPVILSTRYIQRYYLASVRELIRINGTTKAPIMNYAAEISTGVVTIRAFSSMERFIEKNLELIDTDARLFFHTNAALESLLLRLDTLQNVTLFTTTLILVLLTPGSVTPGFAGLALSYALTLTSTQAFQARWYCNLANHIISVERIKQYMNLLSEPPGIFYDKRPPPSWPVKGRIDLHDLSVRYRPNAPMVLKGITCTFVGGNRVGVVGRTGSGKTTLISALFRLVDSAGGMILIDGIDICSIGLKDLRLKLSIIPQEPTLFKGSVRSNLDPLGLYSDHEIWEALGKCQLLTTIRNTPNQLDASVNDAGENWSAGQRQLFCLGRILLRRNRILVLDEATASIDSATDATLQRVIREEFSGCTVLTVAHRVPTVIDSDMVMVLSYGRLVEYDQPSILMETNTSFAKLASEYWSNCSRNSTQKLGDYQ